MIIEGLALAGIAWILGGATGLPSAYGVVDLLGTFLGPMDVTISPLLLPVSLVFVIAAASLASIVPAIDGSRLAVHDALRYE